MDFTTVRPRRRFVEPGMIDSRFCARRASSSFRKVEVHWEKTKHWTLGFSERIFWMVRTMPSILEQTEESSQGSGWMWSVQLKQKRTTNTMKTNWTQLQLLPSPAKKGGSALLLTVPEVQTHRQLLPLAVAGLMPLARHVATGHEPRRLRTAGSTQRQRWGGSIGWRQLGSLENGGWREKYGKSTGNHGFIMVHQSNIGGVHRCPEKCEPNLGACELKLDSLTSRRLQMQVIFFHVSEY